MAGLHCQFVSKIAKSRSSQSICEDISILAICVNELYFENTKVEKLTIEVVIDFNMFCSSVKNKIVSNACVALTLSHRWQGNDNGM